jgi:hypothetical protein
MAKPSDDDAAPATGRGRHAHPRRRSWWLLPWVLIVAGLLVIAGKVAFGGDSKPVSAPTRVVTATVITTPTLSSVPPASTQPSTVTTSATASATARSTWSAGTYAVGSQIPAGTYRSVGATGYCAWLRLRALGGDQTSIIAFGDTRGGPLTTTIQPTDAGFQVQGDCVFTRVG